jgi:hypothetical protein
VSGASTLLDVMFDAAQEAPDQVIVQVASDGSEQVLTYCQLLDASLRVAEGLRAANLSAGTPVILLAGGTNDFLPGFWGALWPPLCQCRWRPCRRRCSASGRRCSAAVRRSQTLASFPQELPRRPRSRR